MSQKGDVQAQRIQLDMLDPKDPESWLQLIEWAKQVSAKQNELQRQIDKLNSWLFPK